jgi:hypothetical protein
MAYCRQFFPRTASLALKLGFVTQQVSTLFSEMEWKINAVLSYLGCDVVTRENRFQNTREEVYVLARWNVTR